jgi:phosphate/sulfate permease
MNDEKKHIKLFSVRARIIFWLAVVVGLGMNAFRVIESEGKLDLSWFVSGIIALIIAGIIFFFFVRHANKPEKKEEGKTK